MVNQVSNTVQSQQLNTTSKTGEVVKVSNNVFYESLEVTNDSSVILPADKVKKMTESMNKFLEATSLEIKYKFHEGLEKYYVTLVDAKTEDVIREIPSKKLMDMYLAMLDFVGVLVDEKI